MSPLLSSLSSPSSLIPFSSFPFLSLLAFLLSIPNLWFSCLHRPFRCWIHQYLRTYSTTSISLRQILSNFFFLMLSGVEEKLDAKEGLKLYCSFLEELSKTAWSQSGKGRWILVRLPENHGIEKVYPGCSLGCMWVADMSPYTTKETSCIFLEQIVGLMTLPHFSIHTIKIQLNSLLKFYFFPQKRYMLGQIPSTCPGGHLVDILPFPSAHSIL